MILYVIFGMTLKAGWGEDTYLTSYFLLAQNYLHSSIPLYALPSDESHDTCGGRSAIRKTPS
jgi:hypothetical protein